MTIAYDVIKQFCQPGDWFSGMLFFEFPYVCWCFNTFRARYRFSASSLVIYGTGPVVKVPSGIVGWENSLSIRYFIEMFLPKFQAHSTVMESFSILICYTHVV